MIYQLTNIFSFGLYFVNENGILSRGKMYYDRNQNILLCSRIYEQSEFGQTDESIPRPGRG